MIREYFKSITVNDAHIDTNGHVNNIIFLQWMQDVAIEHSAQAYDLHAFLARDNGMWVVRRHEIEYLKSALLGDTLEIRTWVSSMHRIRSHREYEFTNKATGQLVVKAHTLWIYLDRESLRPKSIPRDMIRAYGLEVE